MFETSLAKKTATGTTLWQQPILRQERELMTMAAERHWPFRVLGVAPVPKTALYHNNWWLVPISEDHSQIPARALERVQAIYEAGIRPKAFVIAHEAPSQLEAPTPGPQISKLEMWLRQGATYSGPIIKGVATVVTTVVLPLAVATVGAGLLLSLGLVAAVLSDPCLIAVTEDNVWIQIDYWMA